MNPGRRCSFRSDSPPVVAMIFGRRVCRGFLGGYLYYSLRVYLIRDLNEPRNLAICITPVLSCIMLSHYRLPPTGTLRGYLPHLKHQ